MAEPESGSTPFDFAAYERSAIADYLKVQPFYEGLAAVIARLIEACLAKRGIKVHSVQHRAKEPGSVGRKAAIPAEADPNRPKYSDPLKQITDLAGVRVITHFPGTLVEIDRLLHEEFEIVERSDKSKELIAEDRFGYQSIDYVVRIKRERARLAEYERFSQAPVELQIRTILQHAWAEIEHDIQYKSSNAIPTEIRRRFGALAGMLEVADREFQAIQDEDRRLEKQAEQNVARGALEDVEITPNALKLYLDKRLGPDGRISDWTYDWNTRLLKQLGFRDLKQVETAVARYDDDHLSALVFGGRQGQTTRFEAMLLAALGEHFIERHLWRTWDWFVSREKERLSKLRERGIETGIYDPLADVAAASPGNG